MKRKILIVDDDIVTLKIIKKYLQDKFEVVTESSGYKLIEKKDTYEVDLILLDYDMPIVSGLQTYEDIKKHHRLKNIPVVFMTGVYSPHIMSEVMQAGAVDCIVKTDDKNAIIASLDRAIDESAKREVRHDVLVLEGNVKNLKSIRDALENDVFNVRAVQTVIEVAQVLRFYSPSLFIIGTDSYGCSAQETYNILTETLRSKSIRSVVMDKPYFDAELLDKVKEELL